MKRAKRISFWIGVCLLIWGLSFWSVLIYLNQEGFGPLITELPLEERSLKLIEVQYFRIDVVYVPLLIGAILVAGRAPSED